MASQKGAENLKWGRDAVTYVKSKVTLGAANNPFKLQPNLVAQLRAMDGLLKARRGEDIGMDAKFVNPADALRVAQTFAENAERYGAGNCGEQAAVAYMWLRRSGVAPIDWAQFSNKDHSFVIIGRSRAGRYTAKEAPRQVWFSDAVICDAYWSRCDYWSKLLGDYDPEYIVSLLHQEAQGELHQWINK